MRPWSTDFHVSFFVPYAKSLTNVSGIRHGACKITKNNRKTSVSLSTLWYTPIQLDSARYCARSISPRPRRITSRKRKRISRDTCWCIFHRHSMYLYNSRAINPCRQTSNTGSLRSCRKDCTVITERLVPWDTRRAPPNWRSAPGKTRTKPTGHERRIQAETRTAAERPMGPWPARPPPATRFPCRGLWGCMCSFPL